MIDAKIRVFQHYPLRSDDPQAWRTVGPSAVPFAPDWPAPKAAGRDDLARLRRAFVDAAARALRAGFDLVELHCAHGYLLHEFLSPLANQRTDEYGGSLQNRMRLALEVFAEVRKVWPDDKPLGMRVSATDWVDGGWNPEETVALARELKAAGCDYLDVSSGGLDGRQKIPLSPGYQVPFGEKVRKETGIKTMSVGLIADPRAAEEIIASGKADFVVLGRAIM